MPLNNRSKKPIIIDSIASYAKAISGLELEDNKIRYFRGHDSHKFELQPSIYRNSGHIRNESKIIREAIVKCPYEFPPSMSTFEVLVKLQHYGLPTRLLDITTNSLVALYFAVSDENIKARGEVIILDIPRNHPTLKYSDSDTVAILANIAKRAASFKFIKNQSKFNERETVLRLVHDIRKDRPGFEAKINPEDLHKVLAVKAKLDNPRIIRQDGAFLIFGMGETKADKSSVASSWINRPKGSRIFITQKKQIRKELEHFGVSKQTLFPELIIQADIIKKMFGD